LTLIVDLSRSISGRFCARLAVTAGDSVARFRPPEAGGDAAAGPPEFRDAYLSSGVTESRVDRAAEADLAVVETAIRGYGSDGPKAAWGSYGTPSEAASSVWRLTRYPDDVVGMRLGDQLPDAVSCGPVGALAALRGLRARSRTGRGDHFDVSRLEAYVALIGEEKARASGDRAGGGRRTQDAAAASPRSLGMAAFPVADPRDLAADSHLDARGFFATVSVGGTIGALPGSPPRSLGAPLSRLLRPAPLEGEHTVEILREKLSLGSAEIARLLEAGTVRQRPATAPTAPTAPEVTA
jgi:crotonobetainyl-CoA:carnitine CoA-transferase CaiB-like acyl-CoA transferase